MRLYPAVSQEEAQEWLTVQAVSSLGEEVADGLTKDIATMAEAMSIISSVRVPDDLEPLFP
ncbi:MAG: hypothetical protein JWM76_5249 [Pseudonocardiales bacterium]|nr:hypothetical protein [Pseudonocardiales bacterium]